MKVKQAGRFRNALDTFWWFVLRQTRVRSGPLMFEVRGEWFFLDFKGDLFRIRYTGQYDIPLVINLERRA